MIRTKRLILRSWTEEDLEPFAKLNADPRVMEYFPSTLSKEQSDQLAKKLQKGIEERGWGGWAVSVPEVAEFIGFIGLSPVDPAILPGAPVEVGWRLAHEYWGKGYATEGAAASLKYGFETLGLEEIVSFTAIPNQRSIAVMKKIGLHHNPADDFDHPKIPAGHWLRRHVLYRIKKEEWEQLHERT